MVNQTQTKQNIAYWPQKATLHEMDVSKNIWDVLDRRSPHSDKELYQLIREGAVVDQRNEHGRTPLSVAAGSGRRRTVEILVEHGKADINSEDEDKQTPLHWAARKKEANALHYLLQRDSTCVNHQDAHGQTPLLSTCRDSNWPKKEDIVGISMTSTTCPRTIHLLLRAHADPNLTDRQGRTPLAWAICKEDDKVVKCLLDASIIDVDRPDTQGRTPFSRAAGQKRLNIMELLIRHNADPHKEDKEGHTGFWWLLKARHNEAGRNAALTAAKAKPIAACEAALPPADIQNLVKSLTHPDSQDSSGRSWLSWAAEYGDDHIVNCLLDCEEINPSMPDVKAGRDFNKTPLYWALENKHGSIVKAILQRVKYDFPLHKLIEDSGYLEPETALEWITLLLDLGRSTPLELYPSTAPDSMNHSLVWTKDKEGRTPLHLACDLENEKIVGVLVEAIAMRMRNQEDNNGRTPLQYALDRKNKVIVDLLLKSLSTLKPVQAKDWFKFRKETHWIQLHARGKYGFDWALIDKHKLDWAPREGEGTLW